MMLLHLFLPLIVSCLLTMAAASHAPEICTRGEGLMCAVNATCVNYNCECSQPHGLKGDGLLQCIQQDEVLCTVADDLRVTSFEEGRAHISLPCRYRLAEFITSTNGSTEANDYCFFKISGFNKIAMGRQQLGGVDVNFYTYNVQNEGYFQGFMKFSLDSLGIHRGNKTIVSLGSSKLPNWNRHRIEVRVDEIEQFAVLDIKLCGVTIKFRPPSRLFAGKRRLREPGIVIITQRNNQFPTQRISGIPSFPLCGYTAEHGGSNQTYDNRKIELGLLRRSQAILYDMLLAGIGQKLLVQTAKLLPFADECSRVGDLFKQCPQEKRSSAIRACSDILQVEALVRCLGSRLMEAFNTCLHQVCLGHLCNSTFPELACGGLPPGLVSEKTLLC